MRNIEFRAYDSRSKIMYPYAIPGFLGLIHVHAKPEAFDGTWKDIGCGCDEYADYDGEVTMMQFTGVKDSKDNKIFEGDIVKGVSANLHKIEWQDSGYWLCKNIVPNDFHYNGRALMFMQNEFPCLEVIGNVCQNPELLEPPYHMVL